MPARTKIVALAQQLRLRKDHLYMCPVQGGDQAWGGGRTYLRLSQALCINIPGLGDDRLFVNYFLYFQNCNAWSGSLYHRDHGQLQAGQGDEPDEHGLLPGGDHPDLQAAVCDGAAWQAGRASPGVGACQEHSDLSFFSKEGQFHPPAKQKEVEPTRDKDICSQASPPYPGGGAQAEGGEGQCRGGEVVGERRLDIWG